jgi:hypothetical protein
MGAILPAVAIGMSAAALSNSMTAALSNSMAKDNKKSDQHDNAMHWGNGRYICKTYIDETKTEVRSCQYIPTSLENVKDVVGFTIGACCVIGIFFGVGYAGYKFLNKLFSDD